MANAVLLYYYYTTTILLLLLLPLLFLLLHALQKAPKIHMEITDHSHGNGIPLPSFSISCGSLRKKCHRNWCCGLQSKRTIWLSHACCFRARYLHFRTYIQINIIAIIFRRLQIGTRSDLRMGIGPPRIKQNIMSDWGIYGKRELTRIAVHPLFLHRNRSSDRGLIARQKLNAIALRGTNTQRTRVSHISMGPAPNI